MKIKKTFGEKTFDVINILFMIFMMFICFYPFYYVFVCSLSNSSLILGTKGFILWPRGFSLEAYKSVITNPKIFTGYRNTLIILVVGTLLNLALTAMGAFVVTRKRFKPKKIMMMLMVFTMYFSGGMIPSYLLINNTLNLSNTLGALVLPGAISTYNLIILKTNFEAIPDSLEEAACIDGANDINIFIKIILPLSVPTLAVLTLFYGVGHWNSWFNASLYIDDKNMYPLQLVLREILLLGNVDNMIIGETGDRFAIAETIKYATIIVTTLPILCVYPAIQKYFIKGMMIGAVKG